MKYPTYISFFLAVLVLGAGASPVAQDGSDVPDPEYGQEPGQGGGDGEGEGGRPVTDPAGLVRTALQAMPTKIPFPGNRGF